MVKRTLVAVVIALGLAGAAFAQQNVLVNGDFESNPPPNFGNNIGHSISPWVLGSGDDSNVVKVDGPGGGNYGSNGPESDASAPGPGIAQHYLDIANGSNDFYQSFTPQCSGEVEFGGYFSTRANSSGSAQVTLREGVGLAGAIVGQTNQVGLPAGNSATDPWTPVSFTAPIVAGQIYSFIVRMDNNLNFDNGFVQFELECPSFDPCCPPWNADLLEDMLFYQGTGGIAQDYTLKFQPTTQFTNQIQGYIDYLSLLNPAFDMIVIHFRLDYAGTGTTPVGGPQVGNDYFIAWNAGGGGQPVGGGFFSLVTERMKVNHWYRVHTGIYLDNAPSFFPEDCANNDIFVRIQVQHSVLGRPLGRPLLQVRRANGHTIEKELGN